MHFCFVDMEKAFDWIKRGDVWYTLEYRKIKEDFLRSIKGKSRRAKVINNFFREKLRIIPI